MEDHKEGPADLMDMAQDLKVDQWEDILLDMDHQVAHQVVLEALGVLEVTQDMALLVAQVAQVDPPSRAEGMVATGALPPTNIRDLVANKVEDMVAPLKGDTRVHQWAVLAAPLKVIRVDNRVVDTTVDLVEDINRANQVGAISKVPLT